MSFQTDLLHAIGAHLDAAGAATYNEAGTFYNVADNPLYWDLLPESPDRGTAMSIYFHGDDEGTLSLIGVQFRTRGRPNNRADTKNLSDGIDDALNGLERVVWAGADIIRVWRQSAANLGPDKNGRQEVTRNYYVQYTRGTALRRD